MLGKTTEKYLELSRKRKDITAEKEPAPFGHIFGVIIKSENDARNLKDEEKYQTAQDLGYE